MAELTPIPFAVLAVRLFRELEQKQAANDLAVARFFQRADVEMSRSVYGHRASMSFGSAAGLDTQLALNIVLSWLAGGRVIELMTVQIRDGLALPRPCFDMQIISFQWNGRRS